MRKFGLVLACLTLSVSLFASCSKRDKNVNISETPEKLQSFLNTHFKDIDVLYVEEEWDNYDVYLKNGFSLEFTKKGEWSEIDCNRNEMPKSILDLLPVKIMDFINENHKNRSIESIDRRTNGYKLELKGHPDTEIYFDKEGNFKRYDD